MVDFKPFDRDDYAVIQKRYFAELRSAGCIDADPSGWLLTRSDSERFLSLPRLRARNFGHYYIDEGNALGNVKKRFARLLSAWEASSLTTDEFTVCPSGACASLTTLVALRRLGVGRILFETPAYFGTIEQAVELGIPFELLPTYRCNEYALPALEQRGGPVAVWLTQPRALIGSNQECRTVAALLEGLRKRDFVAVDEVTDQSFPAHLADLRRCRRAGNIIRIRSFTKGMGLNGLRVAAVLHSAHLRSSFADCLETIGGSVDAHSLVVVSKMSEDLPTFRTMLKAANNQVNALRATAQRLVRGSRAEVNELVNGYIGSMVIDLSRLGRTQHLRRQRLLEGCRDVRTPVILGASSYMAKDPPREAIRLNFFCRPQHVTGGISNILSVLNRQERL